MFATNAKPFPRRSNAVPASRRSLRSAHVARAEADFRGGAASTSVKPRLPQNDRDNAVVRTKRLEDLQGKYEFDHEFIPPFALAKNVPDEDKFSTIYIIDRARSLIGNFPKIPADPNFLGNELARKAGKGPQEPGDGNAPFENMDDYKKLFHPGFPYFGLEVPEHGEPTDYLTDAVFAAERTSGPNPVMITLLKASDPRAEVLKLPSAKPPTGFTLDSELAKGNVYICDYTGTDPTYRGPACMKGGGKHPNGVKSLPKPLAYFWWSDAEAQLKPIAIQLDCSKNSKDYVPSEARVYTPKDPKTDWLFAKTCVQIADANHHELSTHLVRTHLVMEPIAIAAMRQLDKNHPIGILMRVHMRFIMHNNSLAHSTFFAEVDGTLEKTMAGSFPEIKNLLAEAYNAWEFKSSALPENLKARGVDIKAADNTFKLKRYPFRDYALMLWDTIKTFVTAYVGHFYKTSDPKEDYELQAWAAECADPTRGKVKGFPETITSTSELVDLLTNIIFTCGPMHSAVNYAQKDMLFVPHFPLSAYVDVNKLIAQKTPISEEQLLEMLPPPKRARDQIFVLEFLTSYSFDSLGNWDKSMKDDKMFDNKGFDEVFAGNDYKAVRDAMKRYRSDLDLAESMMKKSNKEENKAFPYPHLQPSNVLNSISI